jgi:hypothetical protein
LGPRQRRRRRESRAGEGDEGKEPFHRRIVPGASRLVIENQRGNAGLGRTAHGV